MKVKVVQVRDRSSRGWVPEASLRLLASTHESQEASVMPPPETRAATLEVQ